MVPGDKLVSKLIAIRPDTPIITSTGYSEKMTPELARENVYANPFIYI